MIAIGSDHGGYALKQVIISHLADRGIEFRDFGTYSEESCDYPEYGEAVGRAVASGECELGIAVCGTGIGISIAANKVHGVRAAACSACYTAEMCRRHNDANVLALGGRVIGPGLALKIVDIFLSTGFDGGRHARRLGKLAEIEARD